LIRPATAKDIGRIVLLGEEMVRESPNRFPMPEVPRLMQHFALMENHPGLAMFAVSENGDRLDGFVSGMAGDYAWSSEKRAVGDLLYVKADGRGAWTGKRLIDHFESWARQQACRTCLLGLSTGIDTDRTERLLRLLGYSLLGPLYRKELS
jgi:GNAT superfamily N-acetyltransferase